MTTTTEEILEKNVEQSSKTNASAKPPPEVPPLPEEIIFILEFLSLNNKIVFKSQQRDEAELQQSEKFKLALDVYQRNPQTFLTRFGCYLKEKHLQDFARFSIADSDEEMHLMVKDYLNKLKTRQRDVKNRRFAALKQLIKEGEYFSEQEMMKRQPELYQELVGQYLSKKEKEQRDSYDVRNTTFSGILMHKLEQKQINEIMEKTDHHVQEGDSRAEEELIVDTEEQEADEIPLNCRQQWGNFDNEQIACSTSKVILKKSPVKLKTKPSPIEEMIIEDERELLRQEFISQMHEIFLTGLDAEFDYSNVDDNTQFDDLNIINQDKEDKYFEESDEDDEDLQKDKNITKNNLDEESEDELDVYMSHLNRHHSLQK